MKQEELQLMQRSSYNHLPPTAEEQQHTSYSSDSSMERSSGAVGELEVFIIKYDQGGLVDSDMAASTQQRLQQTHLYMKI